MDMLKRIHENKTDKFVYLFVHFLLFAMAINVDGLTPDFMITPVEAIQPKYALPPYIFPVIS
jgi:exportin-2 (importin alpha re-exporter)